MSRFGTATLLIAVGAALALPAAAPAAKKHRKVRYTETTTGASVDATHAIFALHDSFAGDGAGTQVFTLDRTGSGGTYTDTTYFAHGTAKSNGTFTLGRPDANGSATLSGAGQPVSGTGKLKGVKATFTYTGTLNTKTGLYTATLSGTYTL